MHRLWRGAPAEARRLLRVLFLRLGTVSADSGRAFGRDRPGFLLCRVIPHGKRGPKLTRLAAQQARTHQSANICARIVPSLDDTAEARRYSNVMNMADVHTLWSSTWRARRNTG
jgi:hypothetical protein